MNSTLSPELASLKEQLIELCAMPDLTADDAMPLISALDHIGDVASEDIPTPVKLRVLLRVLRAERRAAGVVSGAPMAEVYDLIEVHIETAQAGTR